LEVVFRGKKRLIRFLINSGEWWIRGRDMSLGIGVGVFDEGFGGYLTGIGRFGEKIGCRRILDFWMKMGKKLFVC
jgi:hypothetical protein